MAGLIPSPFEMLWCADLSRPMATLPLKGRDQATIVAYGHQSTPLSRRRGAGGEVCTGQRFIGYLCSVIMLGWMNPVLNQLRSLPQLLGSRRFGRPSFERAKTSCWRGPRKRPGIPHATPQRPCLRCHLRQMPSFDAKVDLMGVDNAFTPRENGHCSAVKMDFRGKGPRSSAAPGDYDSVFPTRRCHHHGPARAHVQARRLAARPCRACWRPDDGA